jgi:predicted metal-dependent HD superfamily phosphohydrolase
MLPEIIRAYTEPHRHYHTLNHIMFMINKAIEWEWELTDELVYAIMYHDFVYDPTTEDNEEKSVEELYNFMCGLDDGGHGDWNMYKEVKPAILSTKDHVPCNELSKQLIDLDLAILAEEFSLLDFDDHEVFAMEFFKQVQPDYENFIASGVGYDGYVFNIRREYDPGFKNIEAWCKGRAAWIKSMQGKDKIFHTDIGGDRCEIRARTNLKAELALYE